MSDNDEQLYAEAAAALLRGEVAPDLSAKAFALSDGDEVKAKAIYVRLAVDRMKATVAENERVSKERRRSEQVKGLKKKGVRAVQWVAGTLIGYILIVSMRSCSGLPVSSQTPPPTPALNYGALTPSQQERLRELDRILEPSNGVPQSRPASYTYSATPYMAPVATKMIESSVYFQSQLNANPLPEIRFDILTKWRAALMAERTRASTTAELEAWNKAAADYDYALTQYDREQGK